MTVDAANAPAPRRAWTTPQVELLGTIKDVKSDASGDDDGDGFPENPAS